MWEYHGEVKRDELEACGCEIEDEDDVARFSAIVWFCGPYVLKAVINPVETEDMPYSVMNWEEDPTSIFGYGVSYQMRNAQASANAAWRGMMENGALSVGSQVVIDEDAIEPVNGRYELVGKKVWRKKNRQVRINDAFATFDIPSRQAELQGILDKAIQLADIETNLPSLSPGNDQAPPMMQQGSATGATIWANSSNVEIRRAVKNFDDNITVPTITRFYDWNMQFNPDESIKGDFKVDARGSSALLVKEMQAQNLMQLMQFAGHPVFGPMMKSAELFRKTVQAFQLSADEIVYTDEELEQLQQQMAQQQQEAPPELTTYEQAKLDLEERQFEMKLQEAAGEREYKKQIAELNHQAQMMKLSADNNIALSKIDAELKKIDVDRQNKVDEMNLKLTTGMPGI